MQLFKRTLLSLFPNEIANQNINPASMFVSFISSKEFFSVINRKIVENYKLNLFDIALDPFEFKTGFGENPQIKPKDNDIYYSYCATANLNGYRFLNCANISNGLALATSLYVKKIFQKYNQDAYLNFLYTIYLLGFIFTARIKVFPKGTREKKYNWFIQTFFHFYEFVFSQTGKKISPKELASIKKDLLNEIDIFFLLFITYQKFNETLHNKEIKGKDFYTRMFYDELKGENKNIVNEFINNHDVHTTQSTFSAVENKIMQFILPADILMRYIFLDMDMFLVTDTIVSKIYDKKILDKYLASFRKNENKLESFLLYITDYKHFKKNFFGGVQKYIITTLRDVKEENIEEEIDDLMSSIGDDMSNLDNFKVPERIKKESKIMEKILNFYITLIGGFWISRGDNFFIRLFRRPLMEAIGKNNNSLDQKNQNLYYYGSLLYNYGKNVFYYKYASDNVRAGKQKFFLPYKSNIKNIYSNECILKFFDENFIATVLQDINPKDIRIFIQNKDILDLFKKQFGKKISALVKKDKKAIIEEVYKPLGALLHQNKDFSQTMQKHLTDEDIYHLKESVYNIDFRIAHMIYKALAKDKLNLKEHYSNSVILGICANLRETLLGLLLYMSFLSGEEKRLQKDFKIDILKKIYISDIVNIQKQDKRKLLKIIDTIYTQCEDIFQHRISTDDNNDFLRIAANNWTALIKNKKDEEIIKRITGEDIVRYRGFLKNISYYNKRFLIPK